MMVNPRIVVGSLVMFLVGAEHEPDCDCEICKYRKDDSARQQVLAQRAAGREVFTQIKRDVANELAAIQHRSHGTVSPSEATYWADYMAENFGEPFRYTLYDDLVRDLVGEPESMVGETLLSYLYDAMPQLWHGPTQVFAEPSPDAPMEQVLYLASLQLVGTER